MRSYTRQGYEVFIEAGRLWALHDGLVTAISAENVDGCVQVRMTCRSRADSVVLEVRFRFIDVRELSLRWDSSFEFFSVDEYNAQRLDSGLYYFSIDPFDERIPGPDERDGGVVISRDVEAEFVLKE